MDFLECFKWDFSTWSSWPWRTSAVVSLTPFESLNVSFLVNTSGSTSDEGASLTSSSIVSGRFDIVGQSHQILHVAVVAAIYLHFYGISCLFHTVIRTEQCIYPITLKLGVTDLLISSSSVESWKFIFLTQKLDFEKENLLTWSVLFKISLSSN